MSKIFRLFICLLYLSLFAAVSSAFADYYKYTDGNGVINMTNRLDAVPKKYRSSMKVVKEEAKPVSANRQVEQTEPSREEAASSVAPASAAAPQSTFSALCDRFVWLRPLTYVAGIFALLLVVIKITSLIKSPLISRLIYVAFSLGVFGFLYQTYMGNVMQQSRRAIDDARSIVEKSKARESVHQEEGGATGQK